MKFKKILFMLLLFVVSMFAINSNVSAAQVLTVSDEDDYYSAIDTIKSSSETEFTISLDSDVILTNFPSTSNPNLITDGKTVTILGNGHKLEISDSGSFSQHSILIIDNSTVNLGNEDGTDILFIKGGGENVSNAESLIIVGGTLNMYEGVELSDNHSRQSALTGGAIRFRANGTFNMYGGSIHDNSSDYVCLGGAIIIDEENTTFNMYGGTFANNKTCLPQSSSANGGAIYVSKYINSAIVNIEGGSFINNQSTYGGAISMWSGTLIVKNAVFEENGGMAYGGAIFNATSVETVIENSTFKNNSAAYGGAITSYGGNVTISDSTFDENSATSGGAIRNITGQLTSENNVYTRNTASNNGGALISRSTFLSNNDLIKDNEAGVAGGGICLESNAITNLSTTKVYNNKASTAANDIYIPSTSGQTILSDASTFNATATFDNKNISIDGWYEDGISDRFTLDSPTDKVEYDSVAPGTTYYLTAAGSKEVVIVKFEDDLGMDDIQIEVGQKLSGLDNPTKIDNEFLGWYTDENYENEFDLDTPITENITLYAKWRFLYRITDGADQTFEENDLTITANGILEKLESVKVNDEVLDSSNYELNSGSTILTLNKDYLESLDPGTYVLTFVYTDGSVSTTFTINGSEEDDGDESEIIDDDVIINPETGDNIMIYVLLLGLSIISLTWIVIYKRNRIKN